MSTAQAIVCFDAIHEDQDLLVDLDNDNDDGVTSSKDEEPPLHVSPMQLRLGRGSKSKQQYYGPDFLVGKLLGLITVNIGRT